MALKTVSKPSTKPPRRQAVLTLPPKPKYSLAPGVIRWCEKYIRQPDGPNAGDPWRFTSEQLSFLWRFYAVDEAGRFLWSRANLRRSKGWGKSPFAAALALAELCGPVRFSHWDKNHEPVGKPVALAWVQLAGVSERQTNNTMSMVLAMVHESPIIEDYGLDTGLTRIYTANGGKLEPISASAPTAEGARPTFCLLDETHLWVASNGGHKLAEVMRRNLGKSRDGAARSVETTNAHEMGRDSVAERTYRAWQAQLAREGARVSILYDSREAPADADLSDEDNLLESLELTYGNSDWVDFERLLDEIYDPGTPVNESRRFYLNQLVAGEDAWLSPQSWDVLVDKTKVMLDGDMVALGLDGSKTDDTTALIRCRVDDSHITVVKVWDPKLFGGEIPRAEVDLAVRREFETYDVVAFLSDVKEWENYVETWHQDFGEDLCVKATPKNAVGFDMRGHKLQSTQMIESFHNAVEEAALTHDGNPILAQHVYNARRRPSPQGVSIGKESTESPNKIDAAVAACLSRKGRNDYLALPENKRRRKRTGKAVFV